MSRWRANIAVFTARPRLLVAGGVSLLVGAVLLLVVHLRP